jgi:uncharacterized YigZ family protein
MEATNLTLKDRSEALYKEKGSKFYAFAMPLSTRGDIQEALISIRKEHTDASHHCYAYILGIDHPETRAHDDGEPRHSAGDPILGQIRSFRLTNVLVVVVRYFGGTKLGVGGLIKAYKSAAYAALEKAGKKRITMTRSAKLTFEYKQTGIVERWVNVHQAEVVNRHMTDRCEWIVQLPLERLAAFKELQEKGIAINS